jgi:transposase InsO family protein
MPGGPKSKLLLVFVDTFTGWVEAFPCSTECAKEVVQVLITEIIPCLGLPKSFQSDNGPAFKAEVMQGLSRALGMEYHLHCAWHPQSSGKVEKTNELLKRYLAKLAQETHSPWTKLLPIVLIRLKNTPGKQGLTPFESLYGRPFLTNNLLLDQETAQLISHVTQLAKFQQTLS